MALPAEILNLIFCYIPLEFVLDGVEYLVSNFWQNRWYLKYGGNLKGEASSKIEYLARAGLEYGESVNSNIESDNFRMIMIRNLSIGLTKWSTFADFSYVAKITGRQDMVYQILGQNTYNLKYLPTTEKLSTLDPNFIPSKEVLPELYQRKNHGLSLLDTTITTTEDQVLYLIQYIVHTYWYVEDMTNKQLLKLSGKYGLGPVLISARSIELASDGDKDYRILYIKVRKSYGIKELAQHFNLTIADIKDQIWKELSFNLDQFGFWSIHKAKLHREKNYPIFTPNEILNYVLGFDNIILEKANLQWGKIGVSIVG